MTGRNPARERLAKGELALGIGLRQARTVDIAAVMATCGFDWLFIDLEHGTMPLDIAVQISCAALTAGITPLVRVPSRQYALATRALDGGALGIVMPHVDTAEEAKAIVDHLKYPPLGHRSVAGGQAFLGFRPVPIAEATRTMNAQTLVVVMLETPQAIANADSIAAVPGVDVLLIGTNDLAMEMGIPGEFNHAEIARAYERGGAACLSVLTDAPYFAGEAAHLVAARAAVTLPVLRKDFILDPYQVVEARAMGADCILLIMAALGDDEALALEAAAERWGMDVLAEVHDRAELDRAIKLKTRLIGINNRNLKTLSVDLAVTEELSRALPPGRVAVSESGLHTAADLARMAQIGVRRFLVGESLMKQADVEAATRALLAPLAASA